LPPLRPTPVSSPMRSQWYVQPARWSRGNDAHTACRVCVTLWLTFVAHKKGRKPIHRETAALCSDPLYYSCHFVILSHIISVGWKSLFLFLFFCLPSSFLFRLQ
jgi:hypothetical protein